MIRHAFLAGLLAGAASHIEAQTPVPVSVANDLRACIVDTEGFRDGLRAGELQKSLDAVPNRRWTNVIESAPGVFRLTSENSDITVEIKLPDAEGSAHCFAFGPSLRSGEAALAADKFVEFNFMPGLVATEPQPGLDRRFTFPGLPYTFDLIAFRAEGFGDIVGFTFAGIPAGMKSREISVGDPAVSLRTVREFVAWTLEVCALTIGNEERMRQAIESGGYEFGHSGGGTSAEATYFLPDNSISVSVNAYTCEIDTRYLGAPEAAAIVESTLHRSLPDRYQRNSSTSIGCVSFYNVAPGEAPIVINVADIARRANGRCVDDGTTRIWFEIAG